MCALFVFLCLQYLMRSTFLGFVSQYILLASKRHGGRYNMVNVMLFPFLLNHWCILSCRILFLLPFLFITNKVYWWDSSVCNLVHLFQGCYSEQTGQSWAGTCPSKLFFRSVRILCHWLVNSFSRIGRWRNNPFPVTLKGKHKAL